MSYHPLTSGSDYGVVVYNGTITENGTRNVDLTTLSDDSTASGIPSEICCVHMLMTTDKDGSTMYEVNDNTQTVHSSSEGYGPNVWGDEADVDYFVAGITKSDGSIDIVVPNFANDPTVKITIFGYSDVDWHDVEQVNSSLSFNCTSRVYRTSYADREMADSEDTSVGAGWHKGVVYCFGGSVVGCEGDGGATCDYDLSDHRFAFADLAAYTPSHPDDIDSDDSVNRGAGYVASRGAGDDNIVSFVTNSSGEITFYWDSSVEEDCMFIDS